MSQVTAKSIFLHSLIDHLMYKSSHKNITNIDFRRKTCSKSCLNWENS